MIKHLLLLATIAGVCLTHAAETWNYTPQISASLLSMQAIDQPGGDRNLLRPHLGPANDPLNFVHSPFDTIYVWSLWKFGQYPGAVRVTNPEAGKIEYTFTGGSGGGNRGDLLLFWAFEQVARAPLFHASSSYNYSETVIEYDRGGDEPTEVERTWSTEEVNGYYPTREAAIASIQARPLFPSDFATDPRGDAQAFQGLSGHVTEIPGQQNWVLLHMASTPNNVGDSSSPMTSNWQGSGAFNYDPQIYGGAKIVVEKFNLQRTSGDENKVQYDYYEFSETLKQDPNPSVALTGASGTHYLGSGR